MEDREHVHRQARVPDQLAGERCDLVAARLFPEFSRTRLQEWIHAGKLTVNGKSQRPRERLRLGDELLIQAATGREGGDPVVMGKLPLDIVHEDGDLLVINKAAGVVVHPAAGHSTGTLLDGLLDYCPALAGLPRGGLVHRLDRGTTGLLVVAKTMGSREELLRQLRERAMGREYLALVHGVVTGGGTVAAAIGRHPVRRTKMSVVSTGRHAVSHYRVARRFRNHSLLKVALETGRTHQIRVHMAHIRHAIVGDPNYEGRRRVPSPCTPVLAEKLGVFDRQALHAGRLTLRHPRSGEPASWSVPPPEDFAALLRAMEEDLAVAAG